MRPPSVLTVTRLWSVAWSCCSCRRSTSEAVLTRVLKAAASRGLGFFLSRPIVHGPTRAGSDSPSFSIATAQPSSSSFLITRAVQPSSRHRRSSVMRAAGSVSKASSAFMAGWRAMGGVRF